MSKVVTLDDNKRFSSRVSNILARLRPVLHDTEAETQTANVTALFCFPKTHTFRMKICTTDCAGF